MPEKSRNASHGGVGVQQVPGQEVKVPQQSNAELIAARHALQESDARFNTLADALPHMVWSTQPDGFHDYFNARWYEFTGVPSGQTDGEGWNEMFHPDDRERAWAAWRTSLATGNPYEIEYRLRHHTGEYRWTIGRAMPMRGTDGAIVRWIGTCTDIDQAKRQAEQVEILSRELTHRIKNIFAVVGALIGLSARGSEHKGFARKLQDRIAALGRAHEFVTPVVDDTAEADRIRLHALLKRLLAPYPAFEEGRVAIGGDDVPIGELSVTPLALLVHELATNAAKYGALSTSDGQVVLHSAIAGEDLSLTWREENGPPITQAPQSPGFGTTLAELTVDRQLGGKIDRDWRPEGLQVTVVIPRASLQTKSRR